MPTPEALQEAAGRLVAALAAHADDEYRLTVLRRLARRLGEDGYPLFLRLLTVVAESRDDDAKRLLADTFGAALRRMDMPGGALSSWGATRLPPPGQALDVNALAGGFFGASPRRLLGPVEYLTVWHLQRTQRVVLDAGAYRQALASLVDLFNHGEAARTLYPQKLAADAADLLEGAYTRVTRDALAAIAGAWQAGKPPEAVAQAAVGAGTSEHPPGWLVRDL